MRALIILLCPLFLVLAFFNVIGSFGQKPASEAHQEPLPALHVSIAMDAATGERSVALTRLDAQAPPSLNRLSTRPAGSIQIVFSVDGVEVLSEKVETSKNSAVTLSPKDV